MIDVAKYSDAMEAGAQHLLVASQNLRNEVLGMHPAAKETFNGIMGRAMSMFLTGAQNAADADDAVDAGAGYSQVQALDKFYSDLTLELVGAHAIIENKGGAGPLVNALEELGWLNWQYQRLIVHPLVAVLDTGKPPVPPHDPKIFFWDDYGSSHWPISHDFTPHTGAVGYYWDDAEFINVDIGGTHFPISSLLNEARKNKKAGAKDLTICLPGGEYEGNTIDDDEDWNDAPAYDLSWLHSDCDLHIAGHPTKETWFREATDGGYGQSLGLKGKRTYHVYDVNLIASRDNALQVGKYGNFDRTLKTNVRWYRGRMVAPRGGYRVIRPVSGNSCSCIFYGTYFNFGLNGSQEHVYYYRNPTGDNGMVDCFCEFYGGQRIQAVCRKSEGVLHESALTSKLLSIRTYAIKGTNFNERAARCGVSAQGSCQNVEIVGGADIDVPEFHIGADEPNTHGISNFSAGGNADKTHARPSGRGQGAVSVSGGWVGALVDGDRDPVSADSCESVSLDGIGIWGRLKGHSSSRPVDLPSGALSASVKGCNTPALRQRLLEIASQLGVPNVERALDPDLQRKGKSLGPLSQATLSD